MPYDSVGEDAGRSGHDELKKYCTVGASADPVTTTFVPVIGEFLPIGVVLPAISPVLFGGVLEGTVISAGLAALASTINFWIARTFLREKALKLELFDQVSADYPFFS